MGKNRGSTGLPRTIFEIEAKALSMSVGALGIQEWLGSVQGFDHSARSPGNQAYRQLLSL
jgi:hypothetical protein